MSKPQILNVTACFVFSFGVHMSIVPRFSSATLFALDIADLHVAQISRGLLQRKAVRPETFESGAKLSKVIWV